MKKHTIGKIFNQGKIAKIHCEKNGSTEGINIKGECFLLIVLISGGIGLECEAEKHYVMGPCFICFDEHSNPKLEPDEAAEYYLIYFHPTFLNVNMTFKLIRSGSYYDLANTHDLFLLKPFMDADYIVPITENYLEQIVSNCLEIKEELENQRDWYWSCRVRSYFMEMMIALERLYGLTNSGSLYNKYKAVSIKNKKLREVILYMESHYAKSISLKDIAKNSGLNHTTLTKLMKEETGMTAMEYLMNYRIDVAKKHLAFTDIPLKELAMRCGFKTVSHFTRVFKDRTGKTPAFYRKNAVEMRKQELNRMR